VVSKATGFDGRGNYNLGVIGANYLPEIDIDKVNKIWYGYSL
jgi:large subunit ribosomal protein L5